MTGSATVALRGPHGVIGFVPGKAIDPTTNDVFLAVTFSFEGGRPRTLNLRVSRIQLQNQLGRHKGAGGAAMLRAWIAERARQELLRTNPELANATIAKTSIYWVCGNPARLEPCLR